MEQICGEYGGIAVAGVEAIPDGWPTIGRQETRYERTLAETGIGRDERDGRVEGLIEPRGEARAGKDFWRGNGDLQLGGQDGQAHVRPRLENWSECSLRGVLLPLKSGRMARWQRGVGVSVADATRTQDTLVRS